MNPISVFDRLLYISLFTCIEEFGVGETMAPIRKQSNCITTKHDTRYNNFRPDIFSIIQPVVIMSELINSDRNMIKSRATTFVSSNLLNGYLLVL